MLMPSDHRLTARTAIRPEVLVANVDHGVTRPGADDVIERYLQQSGVDITPDHGVDNLAMAMSLVASTRGLALMPEYANICCHGRSSAGPLKAMHDG